MHLKYISLCTTPAIIYLIFFFTCSYVKKPQMLVFYHQIRYVASCPNVNVTIWYVKKTVSWQPWRPLSLRQRGFKDGKRKCDGLVHRLLTRQEKTNGRPHRHETLSSLLPAIRFTLLSKSKGTVPSWKGSRVSRIYVVAIKVSPEEEGENPHQEHF